MIVVSEHQLSVAEAFRFALRATRRELRRDLGTSQGAAAAIIRATLAQQEGDVDFAVRLLRGAFERASDRERPYLADLLVPLLISHKVLDEAEERLVATLDPMLAAGVEGLCAVLAAVRGDAERSHEHALACEAMLDVVDDAAMRARILGRLAFAAFYRCQHTEADRLAIASAALAEREGAWRYAATAYSIRYSIAHDVTGDLDVAFASACALVTAADACEDASQRTFGLVALQEIAVENGDDAEAERLKRLVRAKPLPPQYSERFASVVADAIPSAWRGDFASFRAVVSVLRDTDRSVGERALCDAFLALAAAALEQSDEARRLSRRALSATTRPYAATVAYENRYRRVARALAACACLIIGDTVRARRSLASRALSEDPDFAAILALAERGAWENAPARLRGYGRVVVAVRDAALRRAHRGILTAAEREVLHALAEGMNAPAIALETGRSVHTIRSHTSAIISKLGAHGRGDAVARARKLGLIEP